MRGGLAMPHHTYGPSSRTIQLTWRSSPSLPSLTWGRGSALPAPTIWHPACSMASKHLALLKGVTAGGRSATRQITTPYLFLTLWTRTSSTPETLWRALTRPTIASSPRLSRSVLWAVSPAPLKRLLRGSMALTAVLHHALCPSTSVITMILLAVCCPRPAT